MWLLDSSFIKKNYIISSPNFSWTDIHKVDQTDASSYHKNLH